MHHNIGHSNQGPPVIVMIFFLLLLLLHRTLKYGVKTQFCQSSWTLVDPNKSFSYTEGSNG